MLQPARMTEGIWRVQRPLGPLINIYIAGMLIIDAGRRQDAARIVAQSASMEPQALVLTHVHPDHQGAAHAVCEDLGIPLACHEADVAAMEGRVPMAGSGRSVPRIVQRMWGGPAHPVDRVLREGDEIGGFEVIHAPGHAPGEILLFRQSDRVAICGDVIRNVSYATARRKLLEPPDAFNESTAQNRDSIRRLAALEPSLVLPGHGPAVVDMDEFQRFAGALP